MKTARKDSAAASHSTSRASSGSNRSSDPSAVGNRAVWVSRLVFVAFLCALAAVLGFLAHSISSNAETSLAEQQFEAIADRALSSARQATTRKRLGGVSLASVAAFAAPDANAWPNVFIPGFERIANNLIDTSSGDDTSFVPLVQAQDLDSFNEFAHKYLKTQTSFPPGTGESAFGQGVWSFDVGNTTGSSDGRKKAQPAEGEYVAPFFQHNQGPTFLLMADVKSSRGGYLIDAVIKCAQARAQLSSLDDVNCDVLGDFIYFPNPIGTVTSPHSLIMNPIYPANNHSIVSYQQVRRSGSGALLFYFTSQRQVLTLCIIHTAHWTDWIQHCLGRGFAQFLQ